MKKLLLTLLLSTTLSYAADSDDEALSNTSMVAQISNSYKAAVCMHPLCPSQPDNKEMEMLSPLTLPKAQEVSVFDKPLCSTEDLMRHVDTPIAEGKGERDSSLPGITPESVMTPTKGKTEESPIKFPSAHKALSLMHYVSEWDS